MSTETLLKNTINSLKDMQLMIAEFIITNEIRDKELANRLSNLFKVSIDLSSDIKRVSDQKSLMKFSETYGTLLNDFFLLSEKVLAINRLHKNKVEIISSIAQNKNITKTVVSDGTVLDKEKVKKNN